MKRRAFLHTTGGMAASLIALNQVFGRFFHVTEMELFERAAFADNRGPDYFVLDVQTHYVSDHYDPMHSEEARKGAVNKKFLLDMRKKWRDPPRVKLLSLRGRGGEAAGSLVVARLRSPG
jgi:hypothetical protein